MRRTKPKTPANDDLIIRLLNDGRIRVEEDHEEPVLDEVTGAVLGPSTVIYTRDNRFMKKEVWNRRAVQPILNGHGYFNIWPDGYRGKQVWLSARRVVWYAFLKERKKTSSMICPIDGDPMNYSRWNLVDRDQNEQNYTTRMAEAKPEELDVSLPEGSLGDELPF